MTENDKSEYIPVPVHAAKSIADTYEKQCVVILCYDRVHGLTHATTFGETAFDKENAAAVAEICTKAIGGDLGKKQEFEDFHKNYDPAAYKEAMDFIADVVVTGLMPVGHHERAKSILKSARRTP